MTDEMIALGKRAVACKGWRWMEGMRSKSPNGIMSCRVSFYDLNRQPHMLPDLTDPATLDCLLALVRDAWDDSSLTAAFDYTGWPSWRVGHSEDGRGTRGIGDTEAEALVAALEAAP